MKNLLIVAATGFEIAPILQYLKPYETAQAFHYQLKDKFVKVLITGPGITFTAYALGKFFGNQSVHYALNVGIAGSFRRDWKLGTVVQIVEEHFGDFGVENADGSFANIFQLDWMEKSQFPFQDGVLSNPERLADLPLARGFTVNKVHGAASSIAQLPTTQCDVESMEGAAFFYACLTERIPCMQLRSISNYVEVRNKANWEIGLAIDALAETVIQFLSQPIILP